MGAGNGARHVTGRTGGVLGNDERRRNDIQNFQRETRRACRGTWTFRDGYGDIFQRTRANVARPRGLLPRVWCVARNQTVSRHWILGSMPIQRNNGNKLLRLWAGSRVIRANSERVLFSDALEINYDALWVLSGPTESYRTQCYV